MFSNPGGWIAEGGLDLKSTLDVAKEFGIPVIVDILSGVSFALFSMASRISFMIPPCLCVRLSGHTHQQYYSRANVACLLMKLTKGNAAL